MIVVTGGAGFIGSAMLWRLNQEGRNDLLVVDNLGITPKWQNLTKRDTYLCVHKDKFLASLSEFGNKYPIEAIIHMGACSSTAEKDMDYLLENNVNYSIALFEFCTQKQIPFIYASSAATYGAGECGYSDLPDGISQLRPINPYGFSKQLFDLWVMKQKETPPFWAGLKFFNVFGPNEYHKEGMRSLVCKAVPQIKENQTLKLFESYKDGVAHGEQMRDFVYVKDVIDVIMHFLSESQKPTSAAQSGVYNVGSGKARSFADLGRAVFSAMGLESTFEWIPMPEEIRHGYQYFTQADLGLLRSRGGYKKEFTPLEEGVRDYVQNYLLGDDPFL